MYSSTPPINFKDFGECSNKKDAYFEIVFPGTRNYGRDCFDGLHLFIF